MGLITRRVKHARLDTEGKCAKGRPEYSGLPFVCREPPPPVMSLRQHALGASAHSTPRAFKSAASTRPVAFKPLDAWKVFMAL